jgi:lambda family phage minor tail protein L
MTTNFYEETSQLELSEKVELFTIDLTPFGDTIYYFIRASGDPDPIVWQGITYQPFDFETDGFDLNGKDSLPTPKVRVSATDSFFTGLINDFNDLLGARITRTVTYYKFLDGQPSANTSAHFPIDVYRIDRKSSENRYQIEFELASVFDQQGRELPGRTIIASYCPWLYRIHNGGTSGNPLLDFDYHNGDNACPYQGSSYFDIDGVATTAANDKCSKRLNTGCKLRFTGTLPYGGFPGASRPIF